MNTNDEIYLAFQDTFAFAANELRDAIIWVAEAQARPSVLYRPSLSIDGNKWCALYGENLQDGVAGFGDSPEEAMKAFDAEWREKLVTE